MPAVEEIPAVAEVPAEPVPQVTEAPAPTQPPVQAESAAQTASMESDLSEIFMCHIPFCDDYLFNGKTWQVNAAG